MSINNNKEKDKMEKLNKKMHWLYVGFIVNTVSISILLALVLMLLSSCGANPVYNATNKISDTLGSNCTYAEVTNVVQRDNGTCYITLNSGKVVNSLQCDLIVGDTLITECN